MKLSMSILALIGGLTISLSAAQQAQTTDPSCEVTVPNGIIAGPLEPQNLGDPRQWSYGNRFLSVGPFGLWRDGTIVFRPGGPGFVTPGGALGMKFGWVRGVRGKLHVTGHRLDGDAPALRSEVGDGYPDRGFQASYLIFPTPGCWAVEAQVGDLPESKLTFVTRVVKVGDGPGWRRGS